MRSWLQFAFPVVVLAAVLLALTGATTAPHQGLSPANPASSYAHSANNGPIASTHPAGACNGVWHVWGDWVYTFSGAGDDSFYIAVSQEWEQDASGNYCGVLQPIAAIKSLDCSLGAADEPLANVTSQIYTTGGTYLGGTSTRPLLSAACGYFYYYYGGGVGVACGTNFHTWGSWLEKANVKENEYGTYNWADGDEIGSYGNSHDLCYT